MATGCVLPHENAYKKRRFADRRKCIHKRSCGSLHADTRRYTPETGNYPKELKIGHLTPIQKPGKPKGPPENLRPIILLSILRKILAIGVIGRINDKVRKHLIPLTQAAYSEGRSTTELVLTLKLLAEKSNHKQQL